MDQNPLSAKYYRKFAEILCRTGADEGLERELIGFFKEDNPRFDPARFREALKKCRR